LAPKGSLDRPVQKRAFIWQAHEPFFPRTTPKPEQLQTVRKLLEELHGWLGKEAAQAKNSAGSGLLVVSVFEARDALNAALAILT
jgi:hypothetical protein